MDLEQFKESWKDVQPAEAEQQRLLTPLTLRQSGYTKNILKIALPEVLFGLLYAFGACFLVVFWSRLAEAAHQWLALGGAVLLVVMMGLSGYSLYRLYQVGTMTLAPAQTLAAFQASSRVFERLRAVLLALQLLVLGIAVVVVPLIYTEQLTNQQRLIGWSLGFVLVGVLGWQLKGYYDRQLQRNKALLQALDQQ